MSLPDIYEIFGVVRLENHVSENGRPDRVAARSTYQRRSSRRSSASSEAPPLRRGRATLVYKKPDARIVISLKDIPYGIPLGPIAPGVRGRIPFGLHMPREGQDLKPGEPLAVVMGQRKLIGPIKVAIPVEIYRVDGSLLWRAPKA